MENCRTLWDKIRDFGNLYSAYLKARRNKRYRNEILDFGFGLEENLLKLREELTDQTYVHGGYREFVVTDSKKRLIKAAPFRDRVVHHAIYNIIEPIFDEGFIYDSYACRRGKGTHRAIKRLESFIKTLSGTRERESKANGRIYCLKCDISKFFDNINHETLFGVLRRKIGDKKVLWLIEEIIESNPKGIPIGNLTSQLFANIYLNELDYYIKRILREKYYLRYMDDFLVLGLDKARLREDKEKIRVFLRDKLKLELHPQKAEIFPMDKGIDFLGYVLRDNRRFLRKSTVKRFLKKRKRYLAMAEKGELTEKFIRNVHASWRGYAKFASSYKLMEKLGIK